MKDVAAAIESESVVVFGNQYCGTKATVNTVGSPPAARPSSPSPASSSMTPASPPSPPSSPHSARCLLPWPAMVAVLEQFRGPLDALVATLPAAPVLVSTPAILPLLTGRPWTEPHQISHHLVRLYAAALLYLDAQYSEDDDEDNENDDEDNENDEETRAPSSPPFVRGIRDDLQRDQASAYRNHAFDEGAFVLAYLRAYERALLKHLHVTTTGLDAARAALDNSKAQAVAPLTYHVLAMTEAAVAAAQPLLTHELLPHTRTPALEAACAAVQALRNSGGVEALR